MSERNLQLEYMQGQLAKHLNQVEKVQEEIGATVDPLTKETLENQLMLLFKEIDQIRDRIEAIQKAAQKARDAALLEVLQAHMSQLEEMHQTYQTTVSHWLADVPQVVESPAAMIRELKRISPSADYSAHEEFVAHLGSTTNSTELRDALNAWGQHYYPERNWSAFSAQIQQAFEPKSEHFQPAILIRIGLAEEATTQANNTPHYQLEAWLVEDIETYQTRGKQRTGYHTLVAPDTPEAAPFVFENLEAKIQPLLNHWLSEAKKILFNCDNDPEFHVFLPKALLHLRADYWPVGDLKRTIRLGHLHKVVICCTDRLDGPYPIKPWKKLWDKHQACIEKTACEVFVEGSDQDLEALVEILEDAVDAETVVGLKVLTAPCLPKAEELFEELLISGMPLAIWGRCDESKSNFSIAEELDMILRAGSLSALPQIVQKKRREARRACNTSDSHIGHHLVLLRDNPTLIPPKSA